MSSNTIYVSPNLPKDNNPFLIILISLLVIFILVFLTSWILSHYDTYEDFCDYDSCSQEIMFWNFSGSLCWDNNNSDCRDFLQNWNACQHYKERIGVC